MMKRWKSAVCLWVLLIFTVVPMGNVLASGDFIGTWNGAIDLPGLALEVIVKLGPDEQGTIDIPMQQLFAFPLGDIEIEGNKVSFTLPGIPGDPGVSAERAADDRLEGLFTQSGQSFPIVLTKEVEDAEDQAIQAIKDYVLNMMAEWEVPGVGLGIIKNGQVLLAEGFGYRDVAQQLLVDQDTVFAIGSATKAFTTMATAMSVDQGDLSWDTPVTSYIPWFTMQDEVAAKSVTLRDMALHRTGLPRHDVAWYGSETDRETLVRSIAHLEPSLGFREGFQYNNFMFTTIGYVLETVTGKPWEANVAERILAPLGMTNTNFSVTQSLTLDNFALPYREGKEGVAAIPFRKIDNMGPAGSINSSVRDMLAWVNMLVSRGQVNGNQLVSAGRFQELIRPQITLPVAGYPELPFSNYGLGWMVDSYQGRLFVNHGGNIDGFSAQVSFLPNEGVGIVVLTNKDASPLPTMISYRVVDEMLGLAPVDWHSRMKQQWDALPDYISSAPPKINNTQPSRSLEEFAGRYSNPAYGDIMINYDEQGLAISHPVVESSLEHWHYDVFTVDVIQGSITSQLPVHFVSGMDGYISELQILLDASVSPIVFTRVADDTLPEGLLELLVGRYETLGMIITLGIENDTLTMEVPGQPLYYLVPDQGQRFKLKDIPGFYVGYELDEQGQVLHITLQQPGGTFEAKPVR